jgi:type I restriction enzyme S subunit
MSEWKEVKLGEFIKVQGGYAFKSKDFKNNGIPIVKIKNLVDNKIDLRESDFVDKKFLEIAKNYIINSGDVLISMTGSNVNQSNSMVGKVAYVNNNTPTCLLNQRVGRLILKNNNIDLKYIFYFLSQKEVQYYLASNASGSANQANINSSTIESLKIPYRNYITTKKIADILSVIDEKIETLQNINEILEEMAKAIFKSWFVNFEIVKAKASGKNDKEIAKEFRINEEIVKLFPSEFVDSDIGKIPKGWEVKKLGDYIELLNGYAFKSKTFVKNGKYGIVTIKNVKQSYFETKCENYINELPSNIKDYQILKTGDILISLTGNVGRVCIVTGKNYLLNQRVAKLKSKIKNFSSLCYFLFLQKELFNKLQNLAKGTAQKNLSPVETSQIKISLPNNINKFSKLFENFFEKIKNNLLQIQILQNLRDTLLPKLINGEIKVDKLDIKGFE